MQTIISTNSTGEELVRAKETINHFLNSCSHSMKGPLKSISGLNLLLKQVVQNGKEDPITYIDKISESVAKLESLLEQFEEFLETSQKQLRLEPVSIDALLESALEQVRMETRFQDVQVEFVVAQDAHLYSDAHAIKIVLYHLLQNAIIFRDTTRQDARVQVTVKVTRNSCSLQISDNGIGIDPAVQANIFDLFYRGSEKSTGTGVGLYIVKEVIRKMSGSISVHSQPGKGANFFVWIPNRSM